MLIGLRDFEIYFADRHGDGRALVRAILGVLTDVSVEIVLDAHSGSVARTVVAVLEDDGCRSRRGQLEAESVGLRAQLLQKAILKRRVLLAVVVAGSAGRDDLLVDEHQLFDEFQAHHFVLLATVTHRHDDLMMKIGIPFQLIVNRR